MSTLKETDKDKKIEQLIDKYPFAFESLISFNQTTLEYDSEYSLIDIETIKDNPRFLLLTLKEQFNFIEEICINIYFIIGYTFEDKKNIINKDFMKMKENIVHKWYDYLDKFNEIFTYQENKKTIETELQTLTTKAKKINYLNRYVTDYKIKSNTNLTPDWFDTDKTLNFLNSELKFWENYIEEPEQQNQIIFKNIKWNKDIIDLSELIYVLQKSESIYINGKNITQKDLTELFNKILNTDIKNISDNLNKGFDTYKRSSDNKTYIKSLYDIIEQRIKEKNNKK